MEEKTLIETLMKRKNTKKILFYLDLKHRCSSYDIAKFLKLGYGEVHRNMKELENLGLIEGEEERMEGELRLKKVYHLTEKGKKILNSLREEEAKAIAMYCHSFRMSEDLWKELQALHNSHESKSQKEIRKNEKRDSSEN